MHDFSVKLAKMDSPVYGYHFVVPKSVSDDLISKSISRLICTINNRHSWHAALISMGNGSHYVLMNKQIVKELNLELDKVFAVRLEKDDSKYGMACPEEMKQLLEQDAEGSEYFHELTPGKQRALLHIVGKPKSGQKRLEKAVVILEYLKRNDGHLDFKLLNVAFREYRDLI